MSDWWRLDDEDGRFVRTAPDAWVYGPADSRVAGLRVPGARDVTLGEAAPPDIPRPRRHASGFVFFRESLVEDEPALSFVGGPTISGYVGVPLEEWEPREGEVVGMRAPELDEGFPHEVALAERDVRASRRERTRAARLRAALVCHARDGLGTPGADVARWIGVSRNRVQQICEEERDASARRPASVGQARRAVRAAHAEFLRADEMLREAEAERRLRVAAACDDGGLSLGAVAKILDVSRPRAQQLRDAGRDAAAA